MATQWNDKRPMAPHLQVWRWHPAMMSSILHRAGAIITYVALALVALGLVCLKMTGKLPLESLIFSPLGAIGLFICTFGLVFMALAQLRHLVWDQGKYLEAKENNTLSYVMLAAALIVAAAFTMIVAGAV